MEKRCWEARNRTESPWEKPLPSSGTKWVEKWDSASVNFYGFKTKQILSSPIVENRISRYKRIYKRVKVVKIKTFVKDRAIRCTRVHGERSQKHCSSYTLHLGILKVNASVVNKTISIRRCETLIKIFFIRASEQTRTFRCIAINL